MKCFQTISLICKTTLHFNLDLQRAYGAGSVWCHLQIRHVQCALLDLGCKYKDWTGAM